MEQEVDPRVLAFINEKRLSGPRLTPVEIVAKMGVFEARDKPFDYAWLATAGGVIATVWAEHVSVASTGRWFCLEPLATGHRADGSERNANQLQRARDRIALLKQTTDAGVAFRAVLQTNRVAIVELESNKTAKVSTRVRDEVEWHVASWDLDKQLAVLVRGPRDWTPTEAEIEAARSRNHIVDASVPTALADQADQVPQGDVQAAALAYVTRHFTGYGYKVEQVAEQKLGYDIEVLHAKGTTLLKVAIKAGQAGRPAFGLTSDERALSNIEPLWRMLVVAEALSPSPQHKIYKASEMTQAPGFDPAV
jgi:hypothetical protein